MQPSRCLAFTLPVFVLACAHRAPPPPTVASATLTSAVVAPEMDGPAGSLSAAQLDRRYPEQSAELDRWVQANPDAARALAAWQAAHPEKLQALVEWSAERPDALFSRFLFDRHDWTDLVAITNDNPEGVIAFMKWMRSAPEASAALAAHPDGLALATQHAAAVAQLNAAAIRDKRAP